MPGAVKALAVVLDRKLPVAVLDDVDLAGDLCCQRVRSQVRLHAPRHVLEVRRRLIRQAHEDQALELAQVYGLQRRLALRGLAGRPAAEDVAGEVVGPAVIRALQRRAGNAGVLLQDARAAVTAGVMEGADRAIVAPQQHDGVGSDLVGAVVAAFRDLGLGREEQPVAGEDAIQLGLVERLVVEECSGQGTVGLA